MFEVSDNSFQAVVMGIARTVVQYIEQVEGEIIIAFNSVATASSTREWVTGLSTTVRISFGMTMLAGKNRVQGLPTEWLFL